MKAYVIFFLLISSVGYSQNLVPNPSFEEYDECPVGTADLTVNNWVSWQYTPDYFHTCNNDLTDWVGVPQNVWGYQYPITGDAYCAFYTFSNIGDPNQREYLAVQLNAPLVVGTTYFISFYVSQIEGETGTYPMEYRCATNHVGLRFFKDPTYNNTTNIFTPDNFAHIDTENIIADSEYWTQVSGSFTADDTYNWVAIGNFFEDEFTDFEIQNEFGNCFGVYFLENVCISEDINGCLELLNTETTKASIGLNVFPNPTSDSFSVEHNLQPINTLSVYDGMGNLVYKRSNFPRDGIIDFASFSAGIYHLVLIDSNLKIINHKILKQ